VFVEYVVAVFLAIPILPIPTVPLRTPRELAVMTGKGMPQLHGVDEKHAATSLSNARRSVKQEIPCLSVLLPAVDDNLEICFRCLKKLV